MVDAQFRAMVDGYGLLTARILYYMPDHQSLLQEFIWQTYDEAPDFPELYKFLRFWREKLDGPIHAVYIAHRGLVSPVDMRLLDAEFPLH
jgi:uncharacterized protein Usg